MNYFQKINLSAHIEKHKYIILSFIILVGAVLIETNTFSFRFNDRQVQRFQKLLQNKEAYIDNEFLGFKEIIANSEDFGIYIASQNNAYQNMGLSFLVFKNDTLQYWSNCPFIMSPVYDSLMFSERVLFLSNSWYTQKQLQFDEYRLVGLTLVKYDFPYENKFLTRNFQSDFNIAEFVQVSLKSTENDFEIFDANNESLFFLKEGYNRKKNETHRNIAIAFYFLFIVILLSALHNMLRRFRKKNNKILFNFLFFIAIVVIRFLMIEYKIPYVFYISPLFDFQHFAVSQYLPSIGDLLINTIVLLYFVVQIRLFIRGKIIKQAGVLRKFIIVNCFPIFVGLWFWGVFKIIKIIILNSNVSFGLYNFLNLSFLSFVLIFIICLLFYSFAVLANVYILTLSRVYDKKEFLKQSAFGYLATIILFFTTNSIQIALYSTLTFLLLNFVFFYVYFVQRARIGFYTKMLFMLIFAFYAQYIIHHHNEQRQDEIQTLYAISIADEKDPIAELLLQRVDTLMRVDTTLKMLMNNPLGKEDYINDYLQETYFSGFLKRYELRSTICSNNELIEPVNRLSNCIPFFSSYLGKYGIPLHNSNYYFINDYSGGLGYFTQIEYYIDDSLHNILYLEITQKLMTEQLGYPELLLQNNIINKYPKDFTFARYKNSVLIAKKGNFPYSHHSNRYKDIEEWGESKSAGYIHKHYKIGKDSEIIVSRRELTFFDSIVSFSYLFLFFFLIYLLLDIPINLSSKNYKIRFGFKTRIQFSIISILVLSLLLIGGSMIFLNYSQYRDSQYESLKEKLFSVAYEINDAFDNGSFVFDFNIDNLHSSLVRLSNIYFTDINIYDQNGILITSSRLEVFDYQLTGNFVDYNAYHELTFVGSPYYIVNDNIGELNYISAYIGIKNDNNETIAFLNLPYFTKQEEFTNRISSLIVTLINIYVMLILIAIVAAVFISGNIIKPLELLKNKMKSTSLGNNNEPILWKSKDEIGSLIEHYNMMVYELAESAQKLAESERKGAWQEMARQIAHEIKNPLTPMKLNIQLLERAWDNNVDDFDERLKRVSKLLVEQIDVLAATANEFSNFAKISEMNREKFNVQNVLESTIALFQDDVRIDFKINFQHNDICNVYADKEKITRVFTNIIKNAIQAISKDEKGEICFYCEIINDKISIQISDNGVGVPKHLHSKMFQPYFTTKTSGSGLGLSICKNIVEAFGGKIWYKLNDTKGTSFFIELPLA